MVSGGVEWGVGKKKRMIPQRIYEILLERARVSFGLQS